MCVGMLKDKRENGRMKKMHKNEFNTLTEFYVNLFISYKSSGYLKNGCNMNGKQNNRKGEI